LGLGPALGVTSHLNKILDFDPRLESADFLDYIIIQSLIISKNIIFNSYIIYELVYLRFYMYTFT